MRHHKLLGNSGKQKRTQTGFGKLATEANPEKSHLQVVSDLLLRLYNRTIMERILGLLIL